MGAACARRAGTPPAGALTSVVAAGASREGQLASAASATRCGGHPSSSSSAADPAAVFSACCAEVHNEEQRREACLEHAGQAAQLLLGPEAKVVRMATVNGRLIVVLDGVVPDHVRGQLYGCLQTDAFKRTEFARPDTKAFRHHIVTYCEVRFRQTELYKIVDLAVQAFFPPRRIGGRRVESYRIYTNAVFYGDVGFVHRDSNCDEHVTALVYPNPEWAPELGGETVFYDEDGEIVEAVEPRPGRLVLFNGSIMHKGSPPSRLVFGTRYTTALKFAAPEVTFDKCPPAPPVGDVRQRTPNGASAARAAD